MTIWTAIPRVKGYEINRYGGVRSWRHWHGRLKHPRRINPIWHNGYLCVWLGGKRRPLHQVMLETFIGPRPSRKHEARHINDDKANNSLTNLAWGTHAENIADKIRNGHQPRGEHHAAAKLTERQVMAIRTQVGEKTLRELGAEYGVSHTAIRRAAVGIKWRHLDG